MKFELGKSYKTRGGWRADINGHVFNLDSDQAKLLVKHTLNETGVIYYCQHDLNGVTETKNFERPFPSGWDHPSDLTTEEWKRIYGWSLAVVIFLLSRIL